MLHSWMLRTRFWESIGGSALQLLPPTISGMDSTRVDPLLEMMSQRSLCELWSILGPVLTAWLLLQVDDSFDYLTVKLVFSRGWAWWLDWVQELLLISWPNCSRPTLYSTQWGMEWEPLVESVGTTGPLAGGVGVALTWSSAQTPYHTVIYSMGFLPTLASSLSFSATGLSTLSTNAGLHWVQLVQSRKLATHGCSCILELLAWQWIAPPNAVAMPINSYDLYTYSHSKPNKSSVATCMLRTL